MRMAKQPDTETIAAVEAAATVLPETDEKTVLAAESTIKNYVIGAVSVSIVPIPLVDVAAVTALQLRMIQKLSQLYKRPFSEEVVRSLIAALGGSIVGYSAGMVGMSMVRIVPVFGWMLSLVSIPVMAGASTYAIGKVFVKHYEEGGTILDLNTEKLKAYYREQYEKGKAVAKAATGKSTTAAAA
jgi:uncharacterized protein (DUF697 family)